MGFLDALTGGVKNHFDKKKEEREMIERMQREARMQQMQIFQEEFKKNALEVAKAKAIQDAERLSGIHKLRAVNTAMRMNEPENPNRGGFLQKLSEHCRKNIAERENNLKRTEVLRETAKENRESDMQRRIRERNERMANKPKPFSRRI